MRGHIRKRGDPGGWQITYEVGNQPAQRCTVCDKRIWVDRRELASCPRCSAAMAPPKDERRQTTIGGFATQKLAQSALNDILGKLERGEHVAPAKTTLAQFLDEWLEGLELDVKMGELQSTTLTSYQGHVRFHLKPKLGGVRLQKLTRDRIREHYAWLMAEGRVPPKPKKEKPAPKRRRKKAAEDAKPKKPERVVPTTLSAASVRRIHATLHRALADAVDARRIHLNPADGIKLGKYTRPQRSWTNEQLQTFLAKAGGDRLRALWLLYATTGARRGELLGLTWQDVDLAGGAITIRRSLVPNGYRLELHAPKTDDGTRRIAIGKDTAAVLKAHKTAQAAEKMAHRDIWGVERSECVRGLDLVFTTEHGCEMHPGRVSKLFLKLETQAKLPHISLHGLRHSFATIALGDQNLPVKVVSARLGHADVGITMNLYQDVLAHQDVDVAAQMDAAVVPVGYGS